jgi:hypothetical protein
MESPPRWDLLTAVVVVVVVVVLEKVIHSFVKVIHSYFI